MIPLWLVMANLLVAHVACVLSTSKHQLIGLGWVQPFTTKCVNDQLYSTPIQYNGFNSITTIKSSAISLVGFDGIVESKVYFKSEIVKVNTTHVEIQASCHEDTLFVRLRFSYILIGSSVSYLDVYNECFLCNPQPSVNEYRQFQFAIQQHSVVYTNAIQLSSTISSLNMSNSQENGFNFGVSTSMKLGDKTLYHKIQAWTQTVISSICITTIVYNFALTNIDTYRVLVRMQEKHINFVDQTFIAGPTYSCYRNSNSMFYGISGMTLLFKKAQSQTLLFDYVTNPNNLNTNYQGNQNLQDIRLSAFFIRFHNCLATQFFDPNTYDCVLPCPVPYGPNPTTKYCEACHPTCLTCQGSASNKCLTCDTGIPTRFRTLAAASPNTCVCSSGYIESLIFSATCLKCSDLIQFCNICTSPTFCSTCQPTYVFNSITNKCGCANQSQYLTNGTCLSFPGCVTLQYSTNVLAFCKKCDQTNNFEFVPANVSCQCMRGYIFDPPSISCVDFCGDGIILSNQCDDGNLINGDGCSKNCTIQTGFFCFNKSVQQPSLCMPSLTFQLKYDYCSRQITSNIATFSFWLIPQQGQQPLPNKVNLSACFNFSFQEKIVSYTYDSVTGKLQVNVEFKKTIEGQNHNFIINMKSVNISTNDLQTSFDVNGLNSWVILDNYSPVYKFIIYGIAVICALLWILGIVASILGYKHLTVELIFPIQAIYFVLVSQSSNAPGLRALQLMKFVNGYNSLDGFKLKSVTSVDDRGYFNLEYLSNINYFILVNIVCLACLFLLQGIHFFMTKKLNVAKDELDSIMNEQKSETKKTKDIKWNQPYQKRMQCQQSQVEKIKKIHNVTQILLEYIGYRFFTVVILLSIQSSIFYLGLAVIFQNEYKIFSIFMNDFLTMTAIILGLFVLWVYPCENDNEIYIDIMRKLKISYTKLYIIWHIIFIVFIIFVQEFSFKGLILIPVIQESLIIVFLILKSPYKTEQSRIVRFILPIVQQVILAVPMFLLWISGFLKSYNPTIYFVTTIMITACCVVGIILTSIRIYFEFHHFKLVRRNSNLQDQDEGQINFKQDMDEKGDKKKEYETRIKEKLAAGIERDQGNTSKEKKTKAEHQDHQQDSSNDDNNEEDLQLVKKRLRNQIRSKRNVKSH